MAGELNDQQLPCLITCDRQTAGRGRGNSVWRHQIGNLAFSVITAPRPSVRPHWLALWTAVCLHRCACDFLQSVDCRLKWPNDLMINDRKNAGILLESEGRTGNQITGVGWNLRAVPDEDSLPRTSFAWQEAGLTISPGLVLRRFLEHWLPLSYDTEEQRRELRSYFEQHDWLDGHQVEVTMGGQTRCGRYLGLSEDGFLVWQPDDSDEIKTCPGAERVRRKPSD